MPSSGRGCSPLPVYRCLGLPRLREGLVVERVAERVHRRLHLLGAGDHGIQQLDRREVVQRNRAIASVADR